jgi:hypothetical protein
MSTPRRGLQRGALAGVVLFDLAGIDDLQRHVCLLPADC